jgi:hypothetical protein
MGISSRPRKSAASRCCWNDANHKETGRSQEPQSTQRSHSKRWRIGSFHAGKPACARRKNALRLGTLPARGGPGKLTASGRRSAATGWSRRTAAAGRPPRMLATHIFRAFVTACSGGFSARNGPTRLEVRLPRRLCCRRGDANPCGGGRGGAPDRARSLWGACETSHHLSSDGFDR